MAQEFTIKSQQIEDKINQLLPTQGGFQPGVDFSASTMVIPIVDLTETAEGSSLRQDLQTALSHNSATTYNVSGATTTVITTTGYFRVIGSYMAEDTNGSTVKNDGIILSDGTTDKTILGFDRPVSTMSGSTRVVYDIVVFLDAGDSLKIKSDNTNANLVGSVRQIADINGNLVNP